MIVREVAKTMPRQPARRQADWAEREELLLGARAMHREGLVVGMVGNISRRLGDRILITPTRVPYLQMGHDDLVVVELDGSRAGGSLPPSTELALHLALYERRPDIGAVLHTHSPQATAWSFLEEPLLPTTEENVYHGIGLVRTAEHAPRGTVEMAENAAATQGDSAAVLLGRHGVMAVGGSVDEALDVARVVERQAEIAWILRTGGGDRA